MSTDQNPINILELSQNYLTFEPVSKNVSVFYDENNRQIFVVQNRGVDGVVVKGPDESSSTYFKLDDVGEVLSMKFSPSCDILALQRNANTIEFINFINGMPGLHYSQSCKNKSSKVIGFIWTFNHEIVIVTDSGIEFYQILSDRSLVKCIKTFTVSIDWFVFNSTSSILLVASGTLSNILQAFQFRPGTIYKLTKFEIEMSNKSKNQTKLSERDVAMATIYGKTCLLVLRHNQLIKDYDGAHIMIYTFQKEGPPTKTNILLLNLSGRFAINIVDDLIIVHHQTSQTSLIFDVQFNHREMVGTVPVHDPIFPMNSIKPFEKFECELYSTNWVIFQPNIIIDARLGCLWLLQVNLDALSKLFNKKTQLIDFLLLRRNSKSVILNVCKEVICSKENKLGNLSLIFNKLNQTFKETSTDSSQTASINKTRSLIDQNDMFSQVFSTFLLEKQQELDDNEIVAIVFEYILSLSIFKIPINYFLYEFLITHLVRTKRFYQLQQFLQYHIFTDSKPLACLLLSLEQFYSHAIQLALDMLKRLSTANEEIIEVLLSQFKVIRALRFVQMNNNIDSISARKYLEVAMNSNDKKLFYSVFKYFELRNLRLRGSPLFVKGEHCEIFVEHFQKLFGATTSLNGMVMKLT